MGGGDKGNSPSTFCMNLMLRMLSLCNLKNTPAKKSKSSMCITKCTVSIIELSSYTPLDENNYQETTT